LSWSVNKNSQTNSRFTLNHFVFTDFVFTYQGATYSVPGSASYVTCTSSYKGECAGYPMIESAFFWLPSASEYVLFDPPTAAKGSELEAKNKQKGTEKEAKSKQNPTQHQDVELGSVQSPQF